MATPNYSYEKRQRELAKKRKAEEKRQKKTHRSDDPGHNPNEAGEPGDAPADSSTTTPPAS